MTRFSASFLAVAAAILSLSAAPVQAASPQATLNAHPTSYSGRCPATIRFDGVIRYDGTGRVQYKFIRSDNANAPVQTLNFAKPGAMAVHTTWTLGGAQLQTYSGWEAIQVIYPQQVTSNRAAFRLRCAAPPAPRPVITGYRHAGSCVAKGSAFTIIGHDFDGHAGKAVSLGGHGIHVNLPVSSWSNTAIRVTLPNSPRIQGGQWYYTGVEKADHSRWLSNINRNITVCREAAGRQRPDLRVRISAPSTATAGSNIGPQIHVTAYNSGSGTAAGTASAGSNGYMIDVMLSSNTSTPAGWATYSANYHEDVLLQGGRISNTQNLAGGASRSYPTGGGIPADTPTGNYYVCAKIDAGNKIAESNEGNNVACSRIHITRRGQPGTAGRLPDLVVRDLRLLKDCKIQVTLQNRGGPLPDSAYNPTQGAAVQMYNGSQPWGGLRLAGIDPAKTLKTPGASVSHVWFPMAANLQLAAGTHTIKVTVDNNNAVAESNEGNNTLTRRLTCRSAAAGQPTGALPDLGMYGYLRIGKQQKLVEWNRTITLTPADATLVSNGKPAFEVYYAYREYRGVNVPGPFKNKIYFNGNLVSQQTNLSAGPSQVKQVHTQAYLGPQSGQLEIKIDADNEVTEAREDNNGPFKVNIRFVGF